MHASWAAWLATVRVQGGMLGSGGSSRVWPEHCLPSLCMPPPPCLLALNPPSSPLPDPSAPRCCSSPASTCFRTTARLWAVSYSPSWPLCSAWHSGGCSAWKGCPQVGWFGRCFGLVGQPALRAHVDAALRKTGTGRALQAAVRQCRCATADLSTNSTFPTNRCLLQPGAGGLCHHARPVGGHQ